MRLNLGVAIVARLEISALLLCAPAAFGGQQDKLAAFKEAMAENKQRLSRYQWVETTVVSLKGEEKSRTQKLCFYGPDGKVQKQQISAPAQQQSPGGLKGKVAAKKKGELTDYMQSATVLVHTYVPPDQNRIQGAMAAGKISITPGQGSMTLQFKDFVKPGDSMDLVVDQGRLAIQKVVVNSYLDAEKDAINLEVGFATLPDGVNYAARTTLSASAKNIQVVVQNSDYKLMQAVQVAPSSPPPQGPLISTQQLDQLTAPIALYPDALIAQILDASTNPVGVHEFAGWLGQNSGLKGSSVQEAAQKAGFDPPFVGLAVFPQVVDMMAKKLDWTEQLGQAFMADGKAVYDSVQRLRKQAQAMGNLKSTPQQQVITQNSSTGEPVIVVQPANPQVVYVPQYNPQVVYVQSAPPPTSSSADVAGAALVGFTVGVIVGAAASNSYYYGPYSWYRPPYAIPYYGYGNAYNNASSLQQQRYNNASSLQQQRYNNASSLQQQRSNNPSTYANQRQETYQQNSSQRQSNAQSNQSQRQSTAQGVQSTSSANQAARQSGMQGVQSNAQANATQRQSSGQSQQGQRASTWGGGGSARQSGVSSGGFSGYQSGSNAQAQSARGNSSLSSSRSSGGRKR